MAAAYLRRSIGISADTERVTIHHPAWVLELPRDWVDGVSGLWPVLRGVVEVDLLRHTSTEVSALLTLLTLQGCVSFPDDQPTYSMREVRELFRPVCWSWYGQYYRHELWRHLREGTLSRRGLAAWLLHNYHVSRSAGMSDARCAVRLSRPELRALFATTALDEYSHCDEYFFVRHPGLHISDEDIKRYVQLPTSLAFDQQMLRMAEDDWLGHLLVSLFQESTARFSEQTRAFYRTVEAAYELPGLFSRWEAHLDLDLRCSHATRLEDVLSSDEHCGKEELVRSLTNAWMTFQHLYDSLDAIVQIASSGMVPALRRPIRGGWLDPAEPLVAQAAPRVQKRTRLEAGDALTLHNALVEADAGLPRERARWPEQDAIALRRDVARSLYVAMSHSAAHEEIMLFGELAQRARAASYLPALVPDNLPAAPPAVAVGGLLRELAVRPTEMAFVLYYCAATGGLDWLPIDSCGLDCLSGFLERTPVMPEERDRWSTLALQTNEFLIRWSQSGDRPGPPDFFRD